MTRPTTILITAAAIALASVPADAQTAPPKLHVNTRWHECSFQIDPSLTQAAWHQFTNEAGLVTYFRPLADARPMGKGKFEASIHQWETRIDAADAAWNDTFVHPDSTHWLFEGAGLKFPGLMVRAGATETMDISAYFTKNPNANYGFYGAQVQRSFLNPNSKWGAAARASFVSLFGPEDIDFAVYGVDLLASRTVTLNRWASVSPYASVSQYISRSHEKTTAVSLDDETVAGGQASLGATINVSAVRVGAEYSVARVRSLSMKVGMAF